MNEDITYCNGIGCAIRESCWRYTEGLRLRNYPNLWWMDDCGTERDMYTTTK